MSNLELPFHKGLITVDSDDQVYQTTEIDDRLQWAQIHNESPNTRAAVIASRHLDQVIEDELPLPLIHQDTIRIWACTLAYQREYNDLGALSFAAKQAAIDAYQIASGGAGALEVAKQIGLYPNIDVAKALECMIATAKRYSLHQDAHQLTIIRQLPPILVGPQLVRLNREKPELLVNRPFIIAEPKLDPHGVFQTFETFPKAALWLSENRHLGSLRVFKHGQPIGEVFVPANDQSITSVMYADSIRWDSPIWQTQYEKCVSQFNADRGSSSLRTDKPTKQISFGMGG